MEATGVAKDDPKYVEARELLRAVEALREQNPMLGLRGIRLGLHALCRNDGLEDFLGRRVVALGHVELGRAVADDRLHAALGDVEFLQVFHRRVGDLVAAALERSPPVPQEGRS